jgi:hypothetical protein
VDRDDWQQIWHLEETNLAFGYPWVFATELVGDWTSLRLIATGRWSCLGSAVQPCGPNGHPDLPWAADRLLLASVAPGALIGKCGGSIASRGDGTIFAIGERCFLPMPEKKNAQLFIGINGAVPGANVIAQITLDISGVNDP